jgi:hypothetical protein
MFDLLWLCFGAFLRLFRTRQDLLLENLAPRQQLAVLKGKHRKPRLALLDRIFRSSPADSGHTGKNSLLLVTPETVVSGIVLVAGCTGPFSAECESTSVERGLPNKSGQ